MVHQSVRSLRRALAVAKRQSSWYVVLGLLVSGVLLYLAFRGADWGQIVAAFRRARAGYLLLACSLLGISFFLRGLRWRVLLSAERSIATTTVFLATAVGYLGNNFLPARAGEVIRSVIIARVGNLRTSYVFATAITERILDTGALVLSSLIAMSCLPTSPSWLRTTTLVMGALTLAILLAFSIAPHLDRFFVGLVERLPLSRATSRRVTGMLEQFLLGMRAFRHRGRALNFSALTIVIWLLDGLILIIVAHALHQSLSLPQAVLLLAALGLSSTLPSAPGYVGIYQFVAVTVLVPFGYSRSGALAYILTFQAVIYSVVIILGSLGLLRFGGQEFARRLWGSSPQ